MGAAAMPLLLGSAGMAVDTIHLTVMKRQMQRAADSAAMAGAYAITQAPNASQEQEFASDAATRDIAKNKTPTLLGTPTVVAGPSLGYARTARVDLTANPRMPFMAIFTKSNARVTATATAALVEGGTFCMLSLYNDDDQPGIEVTGNAKLDLGCGVATNARGTPAITADGSSEVIASTILTPGGIPIGNYVAPTGTTLSLQPFSAEQKDPYASLNVPSYDGSNCPAITVDKRDDPVTLTGGCYSSINVTGGTLNVSGQIVVKGGNINFGSGSTVTGTEVTFFLTGPGGTYDADANAVLDLAAPTGGTYENLLVYRDRSAPQIQIQLNGGTTSKLTGGLYFPTADILINGNATFNTTCFQLVARRLTFLGSMAINNVCKTKNDDTFKLQYVRLVK
jgi:Flp pilus assembly protein TadG